MVEPPCRVAKRKQFHEALLRQLYPSSQRPPSPPPDQSAHQEAEADPSSELLVPLPSEEEGNDGSDPNCTDSDQQEVGGKKLTRSQRKRIKKRKLKEWAALCAKTRFIGPRLPSDAAVDQISLPLIDRQTTDALHEADTYGGKERVEEEKNGVSQSRAKKVKSRRNAKRRTANTSAAAS
ncbi:unnamed protein product [Victoria cruziana]